jgi:hypothetical protein
MFRGQVNVVRTGFSGKFPVWGWFLSGALACVLVLIVARTTSSVLDPQTHRYLVRGLAYGLALAGCVWLTLKLRPRRPQWVEATADHNGIFVDGVPLVLRQDIQQAYIRQNMQARTIVSGMPLQQLFIGLPNYPLTVEIIRHKGAQLNIDPNGEQAAAALLTALGIPVTMCAPDYHGNQRPKRSTTLLTVVIVVVFLGALLGFSYYKYYTLTHH